jgi:hypothetical protein
MSNDQHDMATGNCDVSYRIWTSILGLADGSNCCYEIKTREDRVLTMPRTIQRPKCDGWYWIRNAATEGWEAIAGPHIVQI